MKMKPMLCDETEAKIPGASFAADANLAEFFTKPLQPKRFFELRDKIMNIKSPDTHTTFPNAS